MRGCTQPVFALRGCAAWCTLCFVLILMHIPATHTLPKFNPDSEWADMKNPDDWDPFHVLSPSADATSGFKRQGGTHAEDADDDTTQKDEMSRYRKLVFQNKGSSQKSPYSFRLQKQEPDYGRNMYAAAIRELPWNKPPEDASHRPTTLEPEPKHPTPGDVSRTLLALPSEKDASQIRQKLEIALEFEIENRRDASDTVLALEAVSKALKQKADRDVWTAGQAKRAQTGHQSAEHSTYTFSKVSRLDYTVVMQIACGVEHMVALSDSGNIYTWGDGTVGQLTDAIVGYRLKPYWPQKFRDAEVEDIAAGGFHNFAIDKKKMLFSWGWPEYGQLCRGKTSATEVTRVQEGFQGRKIAAVSGGLTHSLIALTNGSTYACGNNLFGQLGLGTIKDTDKPTQIVTLEKQKILYLAGGCEHSLALTEDGDIWSWGNGAMGQLGHGDFRSYNSPVRIIRIKQLGKPRHVAAGCHHSLAVMEDDRILAWGWNGWGQLGVGDTKNRGVPSYVARFNGNFPLRKVAAGRRHSVAVTEEGRVYTWGCNKYGQLGIPVGWGNPYQKVPLEVLMFRYKGAREICASYEYTAVITDSLFAPQAASHAAQMLVQTEMYNATEFSEPVNDDPDSFEYIRDVWLKKQRETAKTTTIHEPDNPDDDNLVAPPPPPGKADKHVYSVEVDDTKLEAGDFDAQLPPANRVLSKEALAHAQTMAQLAASVQDPAADSVDVADAKPAPVLSEAEDADQTSAGAAATDDPSTLNDNKDAYDGDGSSPQPVMSGDVAKSDQADKEAAAQRTDTGPGAGKEVPDDLPPPPDGADDDDGAPDREVRPFPDDMEMGQAVQPSVSPSPSPSTSWCPPLRPGELPTKACHKRRYKPEGKETDAALKNKLDVLDKFHTAAVDKPAPYQATTTADYIDHRNTSAQTNGTVQEFEPGTSPRELSYEEERMRAEIERAYYYNDKWGPGKRDSAAQARRRTNLKGASTNGTAGQPPLVEHEHKSKFNLDTAARPKTGDALQPHRRAKLMLGQEVVEDQKPGLSGGKMLFDLFDERPSKHFPVYGIHEPHMYTGNHSSLLGPGIASEWEQKAADLDQEFIDEGAVHEGAIRDSASQQQPTHIEDLVGNEPELDLRARLLRRPASTQVVDFAPTPTQKHNNPSDEDSESDPQALGDYGEEIDNIL